MGVPSGSPSSNRPDEPDRGHGWHHGYLDRPYIWRGCLYLIAVLGVTWLMLSLFVDALRFY